MVEQALFFAVGFLVASLATVVAMPIMSRRATRLARAQAELHAPVTKKQAIAERDGLRAVHAVQQVQIEHRLALAEDALADLRATMGRQSVKIIELEAESGDRDRVLVDQRGEIERAASERRDLEVALAASRIALHDAFGQRDRALSATAAAEIRQGELEAQASRDRARIAILAARSQSLEGRLEDLNRSEKAAAEKADAATAKLAEQGGRTRELEERLRAAIDHKQKGTATQSRADAEQNDTGRRVADLEARIHASERIREETLMENGRLLAALAEREADLRTALAKTVAKSAIPVEAAAEKDATSLECQTQSLGQAGRGQRLIALHAKRTAGDLENEVLSASVAAFSASARNATDDSVLRESVERLGLEISRHYAGRKFVAQSERAPGEPPGAEVRELAEAKRLLRSQVSDR